MEYKDIKIEYPNGKMIIHLESFFPTSQTRLKKLLKVVDMDYDHKDELIQTMTDYFTEQVQQLEDGRMEHGKKFLDYQQKVADQEMLVESKKKPSGVRLTKDEWKQAKETLRKYKAIMKSQKSCFDRCCRKKEQFKKHLQILEERK